MGEAFGARLRALRLDRGLRQADLAGPGVSVSYLSMLENGNREPTPRVVAELAARLGVEVSELADAEPSPLDDRLRLDLAAAEFSLAQGEWARAAVEFAALEASCGLPASWGRARALEAVGDLEGSLRVADLVVARAEAARELALMSRAHLLRSRCFGEMGEPVDAVEAARAALSSAEEGGLRGCDEEAQALSTLVGRYYAVGDVVGATTTARRLLELVDAGSSWKARGSAYWNAAGVAELAGDLPTALAHSERALALLSEGDDECAWARCAVTCAWFLLRQDDAEARLEQADSLLRRAEGRLATCGGQVDLAYLQTEQAHAALLRADAPRAAALAREALGRLGLEPRAEAVESQMWLARALLLDGDTAGAAEAADTLEMTLLSLPRSRDVSLGWRGLAEVYRTLGRDEDAYRCLEHALDAGTITVAPAPERRSAPRGAED